MCYMVMKLEDMKKRYRTNKPVFHKFNGRQTAIFDWNFAKI